MGTVARAVYTGDAGELVTISRAAALDVVCQVPRVGFQKSECTSDLP